MEITIGYFVLTSKNIIQFLPSPSLLPFLLLPVISVFKAGISTALSEEGGVGRSTFWRDAVNELCCSHRAGALEGLLCTSGFERVVKMSFSNEMLLALQLSRCRASPGMAPCCLRFLGFTRAKRLTWAEDLACCIKPCIRWSSVCVAWARNPKRWARGGLLTPKPAGYIPAKISTWSFSQAPVWAAW